MPLFNMMIKYTNNPKEKIKIKNHTPLKYKYNYNLEFLLLMISNVYPPLWHGYCNEIPIGIKEECIL